MKLANKNAVITGGSQGLGRAIVSAFVAEGANVMFCARGESELLEVQSELQKQAAPGQKILAECRNISQRSEVEEFIGSATSRLGQIHALVNNAGVYGPKGSVESLEWDSWVRTIETNLYGTVLACRAVIPLFKAGGGGKIINLSGGGVGGRAIARLSAYTTSKAAIVQFTETLAEETHEFKIDVNVIAPGPMNTRMLDEILAAGPGQIGDALYANMLKIKTAGGTPMEKPAQLCVYLASDVANGITGRFISAQWDDWPRMHTRWDELAKTEVYTVRRTVPK